MKLHDVFRSLIVLKRSCRHGMHQVRHTQEIVNVLCDTCSSFFSVIFPGYLSSMANICSTVACARDALHSVGEIVDKSQVTIAIVKVGCVVIPLNIY